MTADPIILTLQMDARATEFFERRRQAHFPAALNRTPAHLTLFHQLPGAAPEALLAALAPHLRRPPFPVLVEGVMPLGRGVAYRIASDPLTALRKNLAAEWRDVLTGQDREKFRPHVTVQNKVTPMQARETLAALAAEFTPFSATAEGVQLWWYRGGPWAPLAATPFAPRR